ncbi:hypothetical protein MK079_05625, partial [Candidatus Gracilibacteria bacterium]|nr:hypothetical protein [Candidatus Gracilibacteria bacterium]
CEGFDCDFEVVVFPKDIEKYGDKLQEDRVVVLTGNLSVNFEYGRRSIQTREMKIVTLSQVRDQARDLDLFDNKKRYTNVSLNVDSLSSQEQPSTLASQAPHPNLPPEGRKEYMESETSGEQDKNDFESDLEEKITQNKTEKEQKFDHIDRYVVDIPSIAKKEDLHTLKSFLSEQASGEIQILISLKGQEIDTKIKVSDIDAVKRWEDETWGV